MTLELEKTMGFDIARRNGERVLHQTLTAPSKPLQDAILEDIGNLLNQAGASGVTIKQTVPLAQLVGYLNELAMVVDGMVRCGFAFDSKELPDGERSISFRFKPMKLPEITRPTNTAAAKPDPVQNDAAETDAADIDQENDGWGDAMPEKKDAGKMPGGNRASCHA